MNIPTLYIDNLGTIEANTELIGLDFILKIADAEFTSISLAGFQRFNGGSKDRIMVDGYNRILNCTLIFRLPIQIIIDGIDKDSLIDFELRIGTDKDPENPEISSQKLTLLDYSIQLNTGDFSENAFLELRSILPSNIQLKCCSTCAYSGYGVYGQGFFGCMICYKDVKDEYLSIQDKDDYVSIMEKGVGGFMETYVCEAFAHQIKNAGYRIFYD